jgi:hypothetical protein
VQLKKVEDMLRQREQFEIEEDEKRKKEEEEEKFDIAALLAKVKLTKNKGGFGFNTKHHFSTVGKIDNAKKQIQHRHSFTSSGTSKKPIINVAADRRATIMSNKTITGKKITSSDNYFGDTKKIRENECNTPQGQTSTGGMMTFSMAAGGKAEESKAHLQSAKELSKRF